MRAATAMAAMAMMGGFDVYALPAHFNSQKSPYERNCGGGGNGKRRTKRSRKQSVTSPSHGNRTGYLKRERNRKRRR